MFAKCEMQMVNFMGTELHETEFYQCDLRKADFRDATGYKVDIGQPPERCKIFAAGGRESAGRSEDQAVLNESSATAAGHSLHRRENSEWRKAL